jgi:5-carboxymethyl-2-hydroxymuconate isomerase
MPHIIAEYSANLEPALDPQGLIDELHEAAVASGIAEVAAIRTRAERRDVYRVADGRPEIGFVHVVARLRIGRPQEKLKTCSPRSTAVWLRHSRATVSG